MHSGAEQFGMVSSATQNVTKPSLAHPKYRPDIDGLRALAVLAVVAFHAFPSGLKGGFIGVDIFFVISGYLISTIIFENLSASTFDFTEFYVRRIRRLFPALLLVLVACFAFGWFVLLPSEYKQLGKHIVAGGGFISNILLWNEAGYFDNASGTKPLIHLWSLGIEEQFYLFWPVFLWLAWKLKSYVLTLIISLATLSFLLNVLLVRQDLTAAFYLPLTRFWELLSGSLLAWVTLYRSGTLASLVHKINTKTLSNVIALLGLLILVIGFWRIDETLRFPGTWALLPVVGTVLIIAAGSQAWVNRVVLSNKVAVWFGLISFPLYLWHWPLLTFTRIIQGDIPDRSIRIIMVLLAIVLAWLTYRFVERPMRFGKHGQTKVITLIVLMVGVIFIGYNTYRRDGLSFRNVVKINLTIDSGYAGDAGVNLAYSCGIENDDVKNKFAVCATDTTKPLRFALIGDSKAAALFEGLVRTSHPDAGWLFIGGAGVNGAPVPVITDTATYKKYQVLTKEAIHAVAKNKVVEEVLLVTGTRSLFQLSNDSDIEDLPSNKNYDVALNGLKRSIKILRDSGKKVVLLVDNPTLPHPEDCLERTTSIDLVNQLLVQKNPKCTLSLDWHLTLSKQYFHLLNEAKAAYPNDVRIYDATHLLCDENERICSHQRNGRFLYSYTDHISGYAADLIGRDLNLFLSDH